MGRYRSGGAASLAQLAPALQQPALDPAVQLPQDRVRQDQHIAAVVESILILIQGLRLSQVSVEGRIVRCIINEGVQLIRSTREFIRTGEAALRRRVVSGQEVVESRLIIPFFCSEFLADVVNTIAHRRCAIPVACL